MSQQQKSSTQDPFCTSGTSPPESKTLGRHTHQPASNGYQCLGLVTMTQEKPGSTWVIACGRCRVRLTVLDEQKPAPRTTLLDSFLALARSLNPFRFLGGRHE